MQKVIRYGILAGIFAVPFIPFIVANEFFFPFITGKNFAFRIIVEVIFALWVILMFTDREVRPRPSALWYALLLFTASLGISALVGENPHKSFWSNFERMEGWIALAHLAAYFTVLTSVFRSEKLWRAFFNTSIAVSAGVGLYGVLQLAGLIVINQGGVRVDATFGNATYLAAYMLFHFFITLYALYRFAPGRLVQLCYAVALVLQGLMIFYAATRGTTIGLLGGLLVSGLTFALFSKQNQTLRRAGVALIAAIIILAGTFVLVRDTDFVRENEVLTRFASIGLEEGRTRLTIWDMALRGSFERPLFGWGQENFNYIFNERYAPSLYAQEPWFDRAHNQFLDWLVAGGLVGLALYLSLYAIALGYVWKRDIFDIGERAIITGLIAAYGFHSLLVFDNLMSSVLFVTVLGYLLVRESAARPPLPFASLSGNAYGAASAAVLIVAAFTLYAVNVPGMTRAAGMIDALSPYPGGVSKNFEHFKNVIGSGGVGRQEAHEQLAQFAVQVQQPNLASLSTPELRNEIAAFAAARFAEELERAPNDARLRSFYGTLLKALGDIQGAEAQFKRAHELSPRKQYILFELGALASARGDAVAAEGYFREAFELEPRFEQARLLLASLLIRVDRLPEADELISEVYGTVTPPQEILLEAYAAVENYERLLLVAQARVAEAPSDLRRLTQLASVYYESGSYDEAIAVLREAIRAHPSFAAEGERYIAEVEAVR